MSPATFNKRRSKSDSKVGLSWHATDRPKLSIIADKRKVLFLCTGNSCRSQMAETLVNHFLGKSWQAFSAGTNPTGYVHPLAIQVMNETKLDLSGNRSKPVDEYRSYEFDVVITVCDDAAGNCPLWLGAGKVKHFSFRDPALATGSEEARLGVFRQIRNEIGSKIIGYLTSL